MAGTSPKGESEFNSQTVAHAQNPEELTEAFSHLEDHCRLLDKKFSALSRQIDTLQKSLDQERKKREKLETELHVSQAITMASYDARSQFLDNMSHEMRTPLNGILGMAQIMLESPLNQEQRENVEAIQQSGQHLDDILSDLLDYSRLKQGAFPFEQHTFDLLDALEEVIAKFTAPAFEKGLELAFIPASNTRRLVESDKNRLQQVVELLLENAIKFTAAGHVALRVDLCHTDTGKGQLNLVVQDTGIGIKEEDLPFIFEPFWQAELSNTRTYGGLGIGLALCQELVMRFEGHIEVTENSSAGITVSASMLLSLPNEAEKPAQTDVTPLRVGLFRMTPINQEVFRQLLAWHQIEPSVVADNDSFESEIATLDVIISPTNTTQGDTLNELLPRFKRGDVLPLFIGLTKPDQPIHPNEKSKFDIFIQEPVLHGPLDEALAFAVESERNRHKAGDNEAATGAEKAKILLIDPIKLNQKILAHMLRSLGYEVVMAEPDEPVQSILEQAPFEATFINTTLEPKVYAEILPSLGALARSHPAHKLIGIQGRGAPEANPNYAEAGIDGYLSMPASIDTVKQLIQPPQIP